MSRPVAAAGDGFVLRPGRVYRLLVVVNGSSSCDALEGALVRAGFVEPVCSAPADWVHDKPEDWPNEPLVATAVNECLVRMSGILRGNVAGVRFDRDQPIEPGATYTIAAAWDIGEARAPAASVAPERAGQAPPSSRAVVKSDETGQRLLAGAVVVGLGVGIWSMWRSSRRYERDEARYASVTARAERDELAARVQHYLEHGHARADAEDMAEREIAAREARKLAVELGG
jgi:hypothetical protein